jgi:hypothetical protein
VNHLTALGVADNAVLHRTTFAGANVNGSQVLIRFTYWGDADLSGAVTLNDFTDLVTCLQTH